MRRPPSEQFSDRVLEQFLKLTRSGQTTTLKTVSSHSRCSSAVVRSTLQSLNVVSDGELLSVSPQDRVRIAMATSDRELLSKSAAKLDWQEFEAFAEQCLLKAGYEARKNVRIRDGERRWQIDLLGLLSDIVLCVDCKHWNTPMYPSRFKTAMTRQRDATQKVLAVLHQQKMRRFLGLPVILTLHEPRKGVGDDVVLVSVSQLPTFLEGLSRYSQDLPFIALNRAMVENPIKGH